MCTELPSPQLSKEARFLNKLRRLLGKTEEGDRKLILHMAQQNGQSLASQFVFA